MNQLLERYLTHFEATKLNAYQDGEGVWTIGTGDTFNQDGTPVKEGDVCTEDQAKQRLDQDVMYFAGAVATHVTVPLSDNQMSALICLTYNIGSTAFAESDLLEFLNKGDYGAAADQFKWWRKDGSKVVPGLVRRRISEARLFCSVPNPLILYKDFPLDWVDRYYGHS